MAVGAGLGAAFGFFFGAGLCAGAGGPAGCNWTNTGFGTSRAASGSLLGSRVLSEGASTRTGTVCGWNPASENVTVNSLELTASEQGVRHDWPIEVLASAPAGSDSNCMVVAAGAAFGRSNCIQLGMLEQAAKTHGASCNRDNSSHDHYRPLVRPDQPRSAPKAAGNL